MHELKRWRALVALLLAIMALAPATAVAAAGQAGAAVRPAGGPPANDGFSGTLISTLPYSQSESISDATSETNEPTARVSGTKTVWVTFTPAQPMTLAIDLRGSDFVGQLGVFTGGSVGALTEVDCANGSQHSAYADLVVELDGGTTYRIQAASRATDTGSALVFHAKKV